MLRYFAIATALVLTLVVGVTAYAYRDLIRIRIKGADLPAPPKPNHQVNGSGSKAALAGDAPWALSALPECLEQQSESHGAISFIQTQIPAGSVPIVPPVELHYADCTIFVRGDEALVARGPDRFLIPPHVRFYRSPKGLVLERIEGRRGEVRIYTPSKL